MLSPKVKETQPKKVSAAAMRSKTGASELAKKSTTYVGQRREDPVKINTYAWPKQEKLPGSVVKKNTYGLSKASPEDGIKKNNYTSSRPTKVQDLVLKKNVLNSSKQEKSVAVVTTKNAFTLPKPEKLPEDVTKKKISSSSTQENMPEDRKKKDVDISSTQEKLTGDQRKKNVDISPTQEKLTGDRKKKNVDISPTLDKSTGDRKEKNVDISSTQDKLTGDRKKKNVDISSTQDKLTGDRKKKNVDISLTQEKDVETVPLSASRQEFLKQLEGLLGGGGGSNFKADPSHPTGGSSAPIPTGNHSQKDKSTTSSQGAQSGQRVAVGKLGDNGKAVQAPVSSVPNAEKYDRMRKAGIPEEAILHAMRRDNFVQDFSASIESESKNTVGVDSEVPNSSSTVKSDRKSETKRRSQPKTKKKQNENETKRVSRPRIMLSYVFNTRDRANDVRRSQAKEKREPLPVASNDVAVSNPLLAELNTRLLVRKSEEAI